MQKPLNESFCSLEVTKKLLEIETIRFNVREPFTWASGLKSPIYCDNRLINSHVAARTSVVNEFVDFIGENYKDVDIISGVVTGGVPLGVLIAHRMNLPFICARQRSTGLGTQVEGKFEQGDKVVLIEDHISTGGSSLRAIEGLERAGLEVLSIISVMTYNFKWVKDLFKRHGIAQHTLCDLDTILAVAVAEGTLTNEDYKSILEVRNSPKTRGVNDKWE